MNKNRIATLFLSGVLSLSAATCVSAEDMLIVPAAPIAALTEYSISVNGSNVTLGDSAPYISGEQIMIPLRLISEKLGFEVSWNEEEQSVHLDNGAVNTTLIIGADSYYMASSTSIGMSTPTSLGAAPELKDETTYAPANLFQILFCDENAVQVSGNTITIAGKADSSTEIPRPFKTYKTIDEALKALPFEACVPTVLPSGYTLSSVDTISGEVLQLVYKNGTSEFTYRTAEGSKDLSGDYNTYEFSRTEAISGCNVTAKGNGDKVFNLVWQKDGKTYSIFAGNGLSPEDAAAVLSAIK